jgi:two-component system sensor histidine kinase PhoQ
MSSLQARFARATVLLLIVFSLLLAVFLDRMFHRTLLASDENRLKGLVYSFLSAIDVTDEGFVKVANLPETIAENKNLSIAVLDDHQRTIWSSGDKITFEKKSAAVGEWIFEHLKKQNHAQQISFGLAWESEQPSKEWTYNIVIKDSGYFYRAEMKNFRRMLWTWLFISCLVLLFLQLILLQLGFRPLKQIANEISLIENGKQHKFEKEYPSELMPLTLSINSLLRHERGQQIRYQQALDNLAHALKTPLTAIKNLSQQKTVTDQLLRDMDEQVMRAKDIVDYQLRKAATVGKNPFAKPINIYEIIEKISRSIQKVYAQKKIQMDIQIPNDSTIPMDEGDFFEVVGNILENAAKYCSSKISITFYKHELIIEDDGAGFGENIQSLIQRGVRQDQRTEGSGIGLSVAFEIISAFGGSLELSKSPNLGGACVRIKF